MSRLLGIQIENDKFKADGTVDEFLGRELGITAEQQRAERFLKAIDNPKDFLAKKAANINAILTEVGKAYQSELARLLNNGASNDKAKAGAMAFAKSRKAEFMKQHNLDFPTDIQSKAVERVIKTA